jgi:hypothetical protein
VVGPCEWSVHEGGNLKTELLGLGFCEQIAEALVLGSGDLTGMGEPRLRQLGRANGSHAREAGCVPNITNRTAEARFWLTTCRGDFVWAVGTRVGLGKCS